MRYTPNEMHARERVTRMRYAHLRYTSYIRPYKMHICKMHTYEMRLPMRCAHPIRCARLSDIHLRYTPCEIHAYETRIVLMIMIYLRHVSLADVLLTGGQLL